uniref:SAM-dependent methyltransferases n=1 Tax=Magnetospirillum gryphiswaldense TaxID=55518 RepID=A4TTX9_9PROT|nr:SAM-dependent methyltransferases [Magnetospirillum gryphiswaldense MSR-1]
MNTDFFRHGDLAPTIAAAGLRAVDIGSRGGFDPDLLPIAWAVDGIGFEPEPQAFAQLQAIDPAPWRSVRWLPFAIGAVNGPATLWIPPDPVGASLLEHDPAVGERFGLSHLTSNCRPLTVDTVTPGPRPWPGWPLPRLPEAGCGGGRNCPSCKPPQQTLAATVAIKGRGVGRPRPQEPAAGGRHGCVLARPRASSGWTSSAPCAGDPPRWRRIPYSWRGQPGYSRGQIGQCDLLYFRRPDTLAADRQTLAAGLIAMALGYFDHALPLLTRSGVKVDAVAHASRRLGRRVAWQQMRANLRELVPLLRSLLGGVPN